MSVTHEPIYSPERLRQHLDASPLSRAGLARELGISENYVFQLCSGRRRITEQLARAIAYTLEIETIDLLEGAHVPA